MTPRSLRGLSLGSLLLVLSTASVSGQAFDPTLNLLDESNAPITDPNDPSTLVGRFQISAPPGTLWALVPSVRVRAYAGAPQEVLDLVDALVNDFPFLAEVVPYDPATVLGNTSMVAGWEWQPGLAVVHPLMLARALLLGTSDAVTGAYAPGQLLEAFQGVVGPGPSDEKALWSAVAPNWLGLMPTSQLAGRQHTLWNAYALDDGASFPIDGLVTMASYLQAQDDLLAKNFLTGATPPSGGGPYEGQPPVVAAVENGVLEVVIQGIAVRCPSESPPLLWNQIPTPSVSNIPPPPVKITVPLQIRCAAVRANALSAVNGTPGNLLRFRMWGVYGPAFAWVPATNGSVQVPINRSFAFDRPYSCGVFIPPTAELGNFGILDWVGTLTPDFGVISHLQVAPR